MTRHSSILLGLALLAAAGLGAREADRLYSSGASQSGEVNLLINSLQPGHFWRLNAQDTPESIPAAPYQGLSGWKQAAFPMPQHPYAGFTAVGDSAFTLPIFFADALGAPGHARSVPLETDPQGDHDFALDHLDLLASKIAFSETRLYYHLKCNSTSYPVSSGLTFYSYMGVLAAPGSSSPVWALMNTVNAPGVISPGLYRIAGTGVSDLIYIGAVEVSEDAGVLTLSCALADLLADPAFSAWFDPDYPLLGTTAMTSRITLSQGNQMADSTTGTNILLVPRQILPQNDFAPTLSDPQFSWAGGALSLQATYSDADQNFPPLCQFSIDGGEVYELAPSNLSGFYQPVTFTGGPAVCPETWQNCTFTFVNAGINYNFTYPNPNTAVSEALFAPSVLCCWPNPATSTLYVEKAGTAPPAVYNLRGQFVPEAFWSEDKGGFDLSRLAPGIYILRQGREARRFLKL